jgi:hypothetical protein
MNIDNLIDIGFDFDKLKSDCLIHDFLKTYIKKKLNLSSWYDSGFLERLLKNTMCFPSECENCVGMKKNAIRKFI